jgi:hypothetical protein
MVRLSRCGHLDVDRQQVLDLMSLAIELNTEILAQNPDRAASNR